MELDLKVGLLIMGSLYWQDDIGPNLNDGERKKFRDSHLDMDKAVNVKVPIRYGRFSRKGGETYTMVYDNKLSEEQYGKSKVVPVNYSIKDFEQIADFTHKVSGIEGGKDSKFIKGKKDVWCVCGIMFNPNLNNDVRSFILAEWVKKIKENDEGYETFQEYPELYSLSPEAELEIPWPKNIDDLDILIMTSTKPQSRIGDIPPSIEEIASYVSGRHYFHPNRDHGIVTFWDDDILKYLEKK